jgi:hypothetical protein
MKYHPKLGDLFRVCLPYRAKDDIFLCCSDPKKSDKYGKVTYFESYSLLRHCFEDKTSSDEYYEKVL